MRTESVCHWCHEAIVDGKEVSGYTGEGPDWMLPDGDFGCDAHPITGEEGCGPHETTEEVLAIVRKHHLG